MEGVMSALESEDYESAGKFVQRFLQIYSQYNDSGSYQREQLLESKKQLEGIARKKLLTAIDQRDHPSILRFVRLYSLLGMEEEGLLYSCCPSRPLTAWLSTCFQPSNIY